MQFLSCRSSRLSSSIITSSSSSNTAAAAGVALCCGNILTTQQRHSSSSLLNRHYSSSSTCSPSSSSCLLRSSASSSSLVTAMPIIPTPATSMRNSVDEIRPGDWLCANCGENNFRFRTHCNLCSKPRAPGGSNDAAESGENAEMMGEGGAATMSANNNQQGMRGPSSSSRGGGSFDAKKGLGDWTCPVCQSLNFKFRNECFSCREARPASERPPRGLELTEANMKPGDWKCPECNAINFRGRTACFTCRSPKVITAGHSAAAQRFGGAAGGGGKKAGGIAMKRGDWLCQSCSEHNFADRPSCFRCGQPRGDAKGYQPGDGTAAGGSEGKTGKTLSDAVMEGDWMCVECGTNNFRRRTICVKCNKDKPGAASGGVSTGGSGTTDESDSSSDAEKKKKQQQEENERIQSAIGDDL